jgi:acyl carrier protein
MGNKIFERIKEFTVEQMGLNEKDITEDAGLEIDLGIYGDDAIEYLVAFSKEFNVDITNFMAADYFSGEGIDIISGITRLFTGKKEKQKKELTMRHLEKAVIAGKLDEEIINN